MCQLTTQFLRFKTVEPLKSIKTNRKTIKNHPKMFVPYNYYWTKYNNSNIHVNLFSKFLHFFCFSLVVCSSPSVYIYIFVSWLQIFVFITKKNTFIRCQHPNEYLQNPSLSKHLRPLYCIKLAGISLKLDWHEKSITPVPLLVFLYSLHRRILGCPFPTTALDGRNCPSASIGSHNTNTYLQPSFLSVHSNNFHRQFCLWLGVQRKDPSGVFASLEASSMVDIVHCHRALSHSQLRCK